MTAVLDRVSLDVRPGEFVAVMGRNGAGKSTLLDIIAGLRTPTTGDVLLDGRPLRAVRRRAGASARAPATDASRDLSIRAEALVLMGRYPHAMRLVRVRGRPCDRHGGDAALRLP